MELSGEDINNMSPEEQRELAKKQCIFCQIVAGKIQSKKLYSDDTCTAILDVNPANPGHILLLPNKHYGIMPLIPDDVVGRLFLVSKHLSQSLLKALKAQGTTVFVANSLAAGQKAQHFMIHIIPRMANDRVDLEVSGKDISEGDMVALQKVIRSRVNQKFGIQEEAITGAKPKETVHKAEEAVTDAKSKAASPKAEEPVDFNTLSEFLRRKK